MVKKTMGDGGSCFKSGWASKEKEATKKFQIPKKFVQPTTYRCNITSHKFKGRSRKRQTPSPAQHPMVDPASRVVGHRRRKKQRRSSRYQRSLFNQNITSDKFLGRSRQRQTHPPLPNTLGIKNSLGNKDAKKSPPIPTHYPNEKWNQQTNLYQDTKENNCEDSYFYAFFYRIHSLFNVFIRCLASMNYYTHTDN